MKLIKHYKPYVSSFFKGETQWGLYGLFLLFFFVIIHFIYKPSLLNFNLQPYFAFDSAYADYHSTFKWGVLSRSSQFLLQFLQYSFIGSLILSLILIFSAYAFKAVFNKSIAKGFPGFEFIGSLIMLSFLKSYTVGLETFLAFTIVTVISLGVRFFGKNSYLVGGYQVLTLYLAVRFLGVPLALPLALIFILRSIVYGFSGKNIILSLLTLLSFVTFTIVLTGWHAFLRLLSEFSFTDNSVAFPGYWLYIIYIGAGFLLFLIPVIKLKKKSLVSFLIDKAGFLPVFFLLIIIGFKPLFISPEKQNVALDYYAGLKEWDKVLDLKDKLDLTNRYAGFQINRALYFTGGLCQNLFSVPQYCGEFGLLPFKDSKPKALRNSSDLFFDMGFPKGAQYWMIEFETKEPYAPRSLKRIATTAVLLGDYKMARKYFSILSKSMVHKSYANDMLNRLEDNPRLLANDLKPKNFTVISHEDMLRSKMPDYDLDNILHYSKNNKMAYEYLMAYYLLRIDLSSFYNYLGKGYEAAFFSQLPKSFEEALITYYVREKIAQKDWKYPISAYTLNRFNEFRKIMSSYSNNPEKREELVKTSFGDSYWYYSIFLKPKVQQNI
ncbi:MAG: DUF6057 family protein [Bacteroidales bacterium]|nr:DUF6057 family protein [Bacteroidales bacterium]